jgi:hypothetical protein
MRSVRSNPRATLTLGQAAALAATRDVGYAWLFDHLEPAAPVARHPAIRHILFTRHLRLSGIASHRRRFK